MAETMNIYQKLAKIRKPVEVLQKNKSGYGYKYVTEDVILSKITGLMGKLGVSLVPNISQGTMKVEPYGYTKTKSTKTGEIYEERVNEILVSCDMEWHWVNNENPADRVVVPWAMVGQQSDASQAFGSGLSYASRYFMQKKLSDEEKDKIYAALKLIENLHKQGLVKKHIFKNILNDYRDCIDLSEFKCYT